MEEDKRVLKLSPKQRDFLKNSNASFNICVGVTKSGKTHPQVLRWINHIYYGVPEGGLLIMSGRTSDSLYDNVIRKMINDFDPYHDFVYRPTRGKIYVKSKNIEISLIGCDNERTWGRVQGKGTCGWLADEIVQHPRKVVDICITVCTWDGKIWPKFWTLNPDSETHFIKTDFIDNPKMNDSKMRRVWNFGFPDNPVMSQAVIDELDRTLVGTFKERMFYGRWCSAEGVVYDKFQRSEQCKGFDEIPWNAIQDYGLGIDWGYGDGHELALNLYAIESDGTAYQIDEIYILRQLIDNSLKQIMTDKGWFNLDLKAWDGLKFQTLKTKPSEAVADSARPDLIAAFSALTGIPTRGAVKDDKLAMIHAVQKLHVKQSNGKYGLYYIESMCPNTLKEKENYRWRKNAAGKDEPVKKNDNSMDAEQYFFYFKEKKMDFSKLGAFSSQQKADIP